MLDPQQYTLMDFGSGRKLEQFGAIRLDRPCPAADTALAVFPDEWPLAHSRFVRQRDTEGTWKTGDPLPPDWRMECGAFSLGLKLTPFGHLGVFPEQQENWDWIARQVRRHGDGPRVLNLFAYTGASTLAAAAAGAHVVHVDAARTTVEWARQNAMISSLDDSPVRWLVEDARRFVRRELRRGSTYDGIILDPPSYGHGPKGQAWRMTRDLMPLLADCAQLMSQQRLFLLMTCHSEGWGPAEASAALEDAMFGHCQAGVMARDLFLRTPDGRRLHAGVAARWPEGLSA